jgi:hypothetical protein
LKPKKVFLRLSRRSCGDQGKKGKEREVAEALLRCKGTHSQRGGECEVNGRGVNPRLRRSGEGGGGEGERERERGEMMMLMMMF